MTESRQILQLYRLFLKSAMKFSNYNFKEFAKRKVRYEFRQNQTLADKASIEQKYQYGTQQLEILRRQVLISSLYPEAPSVISQRK